MIFILLKITTLEYPKVLTSRYFDVYIKILLKKKNNHFQIVIYIEVRIVRTDSSMASPRRFELPTPILGGSCSNPAELRGHIKYKLIITYF